MSRKPGHPFRAMRRPTATRSNGRRRGGGQPGDAAACPTRARGTLVPGGSQASASQSSAPRRAGLVLITLILAAGIANINLAVANVALPDIGKAFTASQTALDMVAIGYSLGLAASVLYLGAIGDRYGRKLLLALGMALSVPACLLAAFAPSAGVLIAARLLGGLSAGLAYPTTLALVTALWSGPARTRSIALWSGIGSAVAVLGPLVSGILLQRYWWGSVFVFPLALRVDRPCAGHLVRARPRERVDRFGGQPRRDLVGGAGDRPDPGHQLRAGAGRGNAGHGNGGRRRRRGRRLRAAPAPRGQSPL